MIIEHAFISNASDVKNFLSSDAKLRRLAAADARAIVRYCDQLPDEPVDDGQDTSGKKRLV